jgi:hypothetical protein
MNAYGTITFRLLNRDGTQPPAGTSELPAEQYPKTSLSDERYKLRGINTANDPRLTNLLWLSRNHPLLFEEFLCLLETLPKQGDKSIDALIDNKGLVPSRMVAKAYILAYYRAIIDTAPMFLQLAEEGYPSPFKERVAYSLFLITKVACGRTTEHPRYKEAMLAVWIMQNVHYSIENPLPIHNHESDLKFIHDRFDEVYEIRHELKARNMIKQSDIEGLLQYTGALREGGL